MMVHESGYALTVAVHGPRTPRVEDVACAVLIDIVGADFRKQIDLQELPEIFLLEKVPKVAPRLCEEIIAAGFVLHVQVPPDIPEVDSWPTCARSTQDVRSFFARVQIHVRESRVYPLALWALPRTREKQLTRMVSAFHALRGDTALFVEALEGGAIRLTAFPSSLTLSLECSQLQLAETWVRQATMGLGLKVEWDAD